MGSIFDAAKVTYAAGPSTDPTEPNKAGIIGLFQLVESIIGTAIEGLIIGNAVVYATRSALYADLAQPAGRLGIVYGDSNAALNGVYVKSGASGSGSWSITNLVLPSSFITDLSAVIAEVTSARQGRGTLLANIASINRRAPSVLASIGGTANAITGSDPLSTADESNDPATSYILIPATTNTAGVTLSVNGDTPRPIRTFANLEIVAGDLVAGSYYLLISDGGRYRVFSGLGASPVKPSDLDLKANLAAFQSLLEEVTNARGGRGNLDARLDTLDETVATKASQIGLNAVSTEVAEARQGRGSLLTNVAAISRRTPSLLASVAGTPNAITASDALSTADESNDSGTTYILAPLATNTDAVTLSVNGDTARPIRTFSNGALAAGDLVAGYYYLLIADGTRYRVYSQLGTNAVRQADVDSKASQTSLQAVLDEIVAARNGRGTLDARLDTLDETVGAKASQTAFQAVADEVTTARNGRGSLDARLDTLDETVATKASQTALTTLATSVAEIDGDVSAVASEVTAARLSKASLSASLVDISRRADNLLTAIAGTANAITATAAGLSADDVHADGSVFLLTPAVDNTDTVSLAINGDTARPVRTHGNENLKAGDLAAGCSYRLRAEGSRYRVLSRLGNTPNRKPTLAEILTGPAIADLLDTDVLGVSRSGAGSPISVTDFIIALEARLSPPLNWFKAPVTAGLQPTILIREDAGLRAIRVQSADDTTLYLGLAGETPAENKAGTLTGEYFSEDQMPPGEVSIAAAAEGTPVTCFFGTRTTYNVNIAYKANALINRYSSTLGEPARTAIRAAFTDLDDAGILWAARDCCILMPGPSLADSLLNWAGGPTATAFGSPVLTPWQYWTFSGANALDTGLRLALAAGDLDHTIWGYADSTIQGGTKFLFGDSKTRMNANRNATTMATLDLNSTSTTTTNGATGGLFGVSRDSEDRYEALYNSVRYPIEQPVTQTSDKSIVFGALHTGADPSSGYTGAAKAFGFSRKLSPAQFVDLKTITDTYLAAVGGL